MKTNDTAARRTSAAHFAKETKHVREESLSGDASHTLSETEVVAVEASPHPRRLTMLHIGRKPPRGFTENGPAIHLGRGVWLMTIEAADVETHNKVRQAKLSIRKLTPWLYELTERKDA